MTGFADCSARIDDACPNPVDDQEATDTSDPTSCSPLRSIKKLAQKIKALKTDPAKVLVAGIFGWPLAGPDGQADFSKAEPYKIDLVPNPNSADTAHPQVFDYWPVCYDPDHRPRSEGTFDRDAWGYGATGGLRHSAFVDEFGDNGLKYSICERDFSAAMTGIGNALAGKMQNLCIPSNAELGKTCTATYLHQAVDPLTNKIIYAADATALPKCPEGATQGTVAKDCYVLTADATRCPGPQSKVGVLRTAAAIAAGPLTYGTKLSIRCE
jgi:hypothetical protein